MNTILLKFAILTSKNKQFVKKYQVIENINLNTFDEIFKLIFIGFKFRKKVYFLKTNALKASIDCRENKTVYFCKLSKICINLVYVCDGQSDCPFDEDEKNCTNLSYEKFSCFSGDKAIHYTMVCDTNYDCPDKSDEKFCSKLKISKKK